MTRTALALLAAALGAAALPAQEPTPNTLFLDGPIQIDVRPDGDAVISWRTVRPTPPGSVTFGAVPSDAEIAEPRWRFGSRSLDEAEAMTVGHSVSIELGELEDPHEDIGDFAANRGGTVELLLEMWNPQANQTQMVPHRFAYRRGEDGAFRRVPCVTIGPIVDCVTDRGAVISWETDMPAAARLTVASPGHPEILEGITTDPAVRVERPLVGLAPETEVHYKVQLIDPADGSLLPGRDLHFRTAPVPGSDARFQFAFMSDSRAGRGDPMSRVDQVNFSAVRRLMVEAFRQGADVTVFAGDLISGYTASRRDFERQLEAWCEAAAPVAALMPIYEGMGNHESLGPAQEDNPNRIGRSHTDENAPEVVFSEAFVNPTNGPEREAPDAPPYGETVYSFDWGNAHFASINSNARWASGSLLEQGGNREGFVMPGQLAWLEQDLRDARARGQRHLFVYTHEPMFPNGGHLSDGMNWGGRIDAVNRMRDEFVRICSDSGVLAVLHGDEHNYSRTLVTRTMPVSPPDADFARTAHTAVNPFWQIISGGAGAPFYAQDFSAPWVGQVQAFSPQLHFVLFDVEAGHVRLRAISDTGQVLDEVELTEALTPRPPLPILGEGE